MLCGQILGKETHGSDTLSLLWPHGIIAACGMILRNLGMSTLETVACQPHKQTCQSWNCCCLIIILMKKLNRRTMSFHLRMPTRYICRDGSVLLAKDFLGSKTAVLYFLMIARC